MNAFTTLLFGSIRASSSADELALELSFCLIDDLEIDRVPNLEDNHVIFHAFFVAAKLHAGVRRGNLTETVRERGRVLLISANEGELLPALYKAGANASTHIAGADDGDVHDVLLDVSEV